MVDQSPLAMKPSKTEEYYVDNSVTVLWVVHFTGCSSAIGVAIARSFPTQLCFKQSF